jgi:arylsulfatase A-like enzyme/Flp pilus assembly protein TadD
MRRLTLLALLLAACAREHFRGQHFPGAPVILISIDTLRSDHLPAYGYRGVETPNIDAFRRDAILFRSAYSPCPMTLPSHLSMLTGLLPTQHGVRDNVGFRFDGRKHESLPVILRSHGYAAGAAVSSVVLRGETGLASLFDDYDDAIETYPGAAFAEYQRPGNITEEHAEKWISAHASAPFFFFFHIYEPHVPYDPPEPFRSRYANRYDGEIATADAIVGKLLAFLKGKGLYDRAIIVLCSDHGEGLGDHGEQQHSILVYREAIQVPLLLKLPHSNLAGKDAAVPAQLSDIAPTILSLLDLPIAQASSQVSLLSLLGPQAIERQIYSESLYARYHFGWSELRSLIGTHWHLIQSSRSELFGVGSDPGERRDLAAAQRRVVSAMRSELQSFGTEVPAIGDVDPDTAAKLASLGYIGAARNRRGGPLPNPRDEIGHLEEFRRGLDLVSSGRSAEAVEIFRGILRRAPDMIEVWSELGRALEQSNRYDEAADAFKQALARSSVLEPDVALALGELDLQRGDLDNASLLAKAALGAAPRRARALLVHVALARKDLTSAEQIARDAASVQDAQPADLLLPAEVSIARGDVAAALRSIDAASQKAAQMEMSKVYRLEFLRADALARLGRVDEAMRAYGREIQLFPNDTRAYANLAVLEFVSGDRRASDETLSAMTRVNPTPAARELARRTRTALAK